jgi:hypothetical protein
MTHLYDSVILLKCWLGGFFFNVNISVLLLFFLFLFTANLKRKETFLFFFQSINKINKYFYNTLKCFSFEIYSNTNKD